MIRFSVEESEFFGIKIGRADATNFLLEEFEDSIIRDGFDVVRIRVDESDSQTISQLQLLPYSYYDYGTIIKYELPVAGLTYSDYLNPEVTLKVYDGSASASDSVKRIIVGGIAQNPIGYWSTPGLESFISRDNEVEYLSEYYSNHYITPEKQLWFIQWNGTPVGFVANNFENGVMDTPLAVVLPEYRGKKLLHEIMISRNNYGIKHGLRLITNGARANNEASQHVFTKFGMQDIGQDKVYHILPMLSKDS